MCILLCATAVHDFNTVCTAAIMHDEHAVLETSNNLAHCGPARANDASLPPCSTLDPVLRMEQQGVTPQGLALILAVFAYLFAKPGDALLHASCTV